jgi:gluconolactonase
LNRITETALLFSCLLLGVACNQDTRSAGLGRILKTDPALNHVVPADAKLEKLVAGFELLEGPVWSVSGDLLFSDMVNHFIYKWNSQSGLSVFPAKMEYARVEPEKRSSGPNGLAFDPKGRLTICEHGNRRVTRLEKDGSLKVLVERYEGKRLNSPNDLVYRSDGLLYFTDPPSGLSGKHADPRKELPYSGVFLFAEGKLVLVSDELHNPNGLAFSPDEKYLYVANHKNPIIMRYEVNPDGSFANGEVFFDAATATRAGWLDGMKVDVEGNVYVTAQSGVVIIDGRGKHLGSIQAPEELTNLAWGDDDRKSLYITALKGLYRIRLNIPGTQSFSRQPNDAARS